MIDSVISAGRYRMGRPLGRGGMAEVRLGLDINTGHAVAVKYLSGELGSDEEAQQLFASEITAAAVLNHPGVVRVLDSGESEDLATGVPTPYLVMEFVPGHSLAALTCRSQPVTTEKALALTRDLLDALAYCHDVGLIHGDIKPANVMVMPTGRIKLMDFGLARHAGGSPGGTDIVPRFLTIRYASPEQVQQAPPDARSDLYSVGCVLYELLTGKPPFSGDPEEVFAHHLFDRPEAPSKYNPDIGPEVDAIVLQALEKFPQDRYPSAAAMIKEIDRVLESNQARSDATAVSAIVPAMEPPYWPALTVLARARDVRRHRLIRSVSAVAAALLPVAGFGLLHLRGPGEVGGASAALALGGVVQPGVAPSRTDEVASSQATPHLSRVGVNEVGIGLGNGTGTMPFAGDPASRTLTSVVALRRSARAAGGEAPLGTVVLGANARSQAQQPELGGPKVPEPDAPRPDQPRSEPSKPPKPDAPKPEKPKPDAPKPEKPKPDAPKPEKPKPDKPDSPKPEKPKPNKPDTPKPDKPKPDTPKPDKPKPDKPKPDKPKPEEPDKSNAGEPDPTET